MGQLSEKELSLLGDLLADEQLLTKKFKMLASQTQDAEIKQKFERIGGRVCSNIQTKKF